VAKTIIAFCGVAGSGKDTACNYLVERGFKKATFAAPLKQMAKIAFGFTDEQLYGSSSKREEQDERYPFSGICMKCGAHCTDWDGIPFVLDRPDNFDGALHRHYCEVCEIAYPRFVNARLALQSLGTEWGRRLNSDLWAKAGVNQILDSDHDLWCISDLRFKNEMQAVSEAGGVIVRLTRGVAKYNHQSEQELLSIPEHMFHCTIDNTGDLALLYRGIDIVLSLWGPGKNDE
jgi:hypothetical protein